MTNENGKKEEYTPIISSKMNNIRLELMIEFGGLK